MVSMYVHIQIPLWLLFHAVSIFWGLKFPIHYRSYQASGKIRYIHATLFISGILVSLVNALVPFGAGGYGHSLAVPPVLCLPNKLSVYFYLQALPFLVVVMIALVLFLSIFWIVVKVIFSLRRLYRKTDTLENYTCMQAILHVSGMLLTV